MCSLWSLWVSLSWRCVAAVLEPSYLSVFPAADRGPMKYYIAKTVSGDFPAIVERVIDSLKAEGFGVLTDIDVKATMKKKLDIDFRDYRILGACNPPLAHQALTADDKIGTMLPCNVIVQDLGGGQIEVAAIDPAISMEQVGNPTLKIIAESVTGKLRRVIAAI